MKTAYWRDPDWRYRTAQETQAPGYLERRFKEIREQLAQESQRVINPAAATDEIRTTQ